MSLEVKNLCFSYNKKRSVLNDISFNAGSGEMITLLGQNGAGKTTLFRCLLGFLKPTSGQILLKNIPVTEYNAKVLASNIAYIPQSYSPVFNHTVKDSVMMGLTGQLGLFSNPGKEEESKVMEVLESMGIASLAEMGCMKISGGERQLMLICRAIIQNAKILIMDEPTSSLDYGNSFKVMQKILSLKEQGYTIIISTHNPEQALRYSDRIIALKQGSIIADVKASQINESILSEIYNVNVHVSDIKIGDNTYLTCTPYGD
ncbi:MAG: ABC transporter ATP-binding protein [Sphaerochaetaceae bacterium]|nr:ABC transporter ATP-binding protein [Sphaerochaetaceae bacterium]